MVVLSLLWMLCLISAALCIGRPANDNWGEFGPFTACSRTCGTGVAVRTRVCNTRRMDGRHNCVGPSKSYRVCNTQECPGGSRDLREEQCSQFDRVAFQGKRYTWQPYHGGSNPCELVCAPRGETVSHRQRAAVADGTPCHAGGGDVCVGGVCRAVSRGEIVDFEESAFPVTSRHSPGTADRVMDTYRYTYGPYSECSVHCGQGLQTRAVRCIHERTSAAVDESHCTAQGLRRPASQQACNQPRCVEYSVGPFSECSVTCGEGQQTREVFCVGGRGERVPEHHCSGLARPRDITSCQRPACHQTFRYYTNDFSLCSRSCGTGTRTRRVVCMDVNLSQYADERCASLTKPHAVENCNTQPCSSSTQMVPSIQNPDGYERLLRGFEPYTLDSPSVYRPSDPYSAVIGPHCVQSYFGCCPDGQTAASGPQGEGCGEEDCHRTRYGCCLDGVTAAQGLGRAGCPVSRDHSPAPLPSASTSTCSLTKDVGSCHEWTPRYYFDRSSGTCSHFWYGGCHGNSNNFVSKEECERTCKETSRSPSQRQQTPRNGLRRVRVYRPRPHARA